MQSVPKVSIKFVLYTAGCMFLEVVFGEFAEVRRKDHELKGEKFLGH